MAGFNNGFLNANNFAFFAYQNTTQTNITGDGTTATVICNTKIFDPFSGYNTSTGIYTIPSNFNTGTWFLQGKVTFTGITASHTAAVLAVNNFNRNLYFEINSATARTSNNELTMEVSGYINGLAAGNTISLQLQVLGGTKVISTKSTGDQWCDFGGYFVG